MKKIKTKHIILFIGIICILMAIIVTIMSTKKDTAHLIDFRNFTDEELSEYNGKIVVIYGYYLLNAPIDNMAYIAEMPFRAILNSGENYIETNLSENGFIPVYMQNIGEFTSAPRKFVGILKKGDFKDINGFSYKYILTDVVEYEIDNYLLPENVVYYKMLANHGYPDALYTIFLQCQMRLSKVIEEMADIDELLEIPGTLSDNTIDIEYGKLFNKTVNLYNEIKKADLENQEELSKYQDEFDILYSEFSDFLYRNAALLLDTETIKEN